MTNGSSRHRLVDNYIVRIYRRGRQGPTALDGIVEIVDSGARISFHGCEELWDILMRDTRTYTGGDGRLGGG